MKRKGIMIPTAITAPGIEYPNTEILARLLIKTFLFNFTEYIKIMAMKTQQKEAVRAMVKLLITISIN